MRILLSVVLFLVVSTLSADYEWTFNVGGRIYTVPKIIDGQSIDESLARKSISDTVGQNVQPALFNTPRDPAPLKEIATVIPKTIQYEPLQYQPTFSYPTVSSASCTIVNGKKT